MREVTFEYLHRGKRQTKTVNIPSTMSEASPEQFLALVSFSMGAIDEELFFKTFFYIDSKILSMLDPWQVYVIGQQLRDLWKLDKVDHFFLDSMDLHGQRLIAPAKQLKGMSFQQFMTIDQFFQWYLYTERASYEAAMVAAAYIPEGKDFFHYDHAALTEDLLTNGNPCIIKGVLMNWSMIRGWLSSAYPKLFPEAMSGTDDSVPHKKQRPGSWLDIFDKLVGDDLTRIELYPKIPCMDVIRILNKRLSK